MSKKFPCDICYKEYTTKQNLDKHKCPVDKDLEHKCPHPNCLYSSDKKYNTDNHAIVCQLKPQIIDNSTNVIDNSNNSKNITDNSNNTNNITNIIDNSKNINIINLHITTPWDKPLISYELEVSIARYLSNTRPNKVNARDILENVFKLIYFSEKHTENHSILMTNKRKGEVSVFENQRYISKNM